MRRKIAKMLTEQVNPYVADHGGSINLVDYVDGIVYLEMAGGCQGCAQSSATLRQGVENLLREEFGDKITQIIDVTDHAMGDNPYYA